MERQQQGTNQEKEDDPCMTDTCPRAQQPTRILFSVRSAVTAVLYVVLSVVSCETRQPTSASFKKALDMTRHVFHTLSVPLRPSTAAAVGLD